MIKRLDNFPTYSDGRGREKTSKGFQSDDVSFRARSRKPPSFPILSLKGLDFASDVTDSYVKARIFNP